VLWLWLMWVCGLALAQGVPAVGADEAEPVPSEQPAPAAPLTIAVSSFPPFVILDGDEPRGFSVDLWRSLADAEGLPYRFQEHPDVQSKLDAVAQGHADVAIGGITITLERERGVDFTLPVFRTGLDIMVPASDGEFRVGSLFKVFTRGRITILVGFVLLIITAGHLVWWAERGKDAFSDDYIPGVVEGFYWAIVTASTVGYGDKAPVRWPGRAVAALVIVVSLPMFAIFTAELTSAFTVANLDTGIEGPDDLAGRRVGVVANTASVRPAAATDAVLVRYDTLDDAAAALVEERIVAVVYDAPALQFQVARSDGSLAVVDALFEPQPYGIAVQPASPLRERLNRALLEIRETERWSAIRDEWFSHGLGE